MTIDDYRAILDLWDAAGLPYRVKGRDSRESIAKEIERPFCRFLGLFFEDRMLAVGIAHWDGRRGWISRLAVDPEYRGIGLAGRVIDELEIFLRSQGATVIGALIEEENEPSMTAFEKAGYSCEPNIKFFAKRPSPDA